MPQACSSLENLNEESWWLYKFSAIYSWTCAMWVGAKSCWDIWSPLSHQRLTTVSITLCYISVGTSRVACNDFYSSLPPEPQQMIWTWCTYQWITLLVCLDWSSHQSRTKPCSSPCGTGIVLVDLVSLEMPSSHRTCTWCPCMLHVWQ